MVRIAITGSIFFILLFSINLQGANTDKLVLQDIQNSENQNQDSLTWSVDFLNKLLYSCNEWHLTDSQLKSPIKGVLNYAENAPLDSAIVSISKLLSDGNVLYMVERQPQDIRNTNEVAGYISPADIEKGAEALRKIVFDSLNNTNIVVPQAIMVVELLKAPNVPEGDPALLIGKKKLLPPDFAANLSVKLEALIFPNISFFIFFNKATRFFEWAGFAYKYEAIVFPFKQT